MRPVPVPLVRKVTTTPRPPPATGEPPPRPPTAAVELNGGPDAAEPVAGNALAGGAAKAAVEADGYKRVILLGRGSNGTWRVKGHRGNTEVVLTVDEVGSVTME
jgi:hypothetical protein